MSIHSICKKNVVTVKADATLAEASRLMQEEHVGSLVVIESFNGKGVPVGIITDRDLALTLYSNQKPQSLAVQAVMQSHPITVETDEGIFETLRTMRSHGVKRVPVTDKTGALYGIVCSDDLLSLLGEEIQQLSQVVDVQVKNEKGLKIPVERHLYA